MCGTKKVMWEERKYYDKKAPRKIWSGTLKQMLLKDREWSELNGTKQSLLVPIEGGFFTDQN